MILDDSLTHKRVEVAERRAAIPIEQLRDQALQQSPARDFISALRQALHRPALIAECKQASPSKGLLRAIYDPTRLAHTYTDNGASALSVLTDDKFFQGSLDHLIAARQAVSLPVLRKDFIVDEYQVYEARAAGADAILLIAAALDRLKLQSFHRLARELGMAALIEVHDAAQLDLALSIGPRLIGINNRDLRDFSVDLETTARLRLRIPGDIVVVSESGIHSADDAAWLASSGVDAILVGEALIVARDMGAKVRELSKLATGSI